MNKPTLPNFRQVTRTELKDNISFYLKSLKRLGSFYISINGKIVAQVSAVNQEEEITND